MHDAEDQPTGGTGRYWELTIESWPLFPFAADGGDAFEPSPFNPDGL